MFNSEGSIEYARLVARTWSDPEFRDRFIANPAEVLGQHGISVPPGVVVSVAPGAGTTRVELALPERPDLTHENLERGTAVAQTAKCAGAVAQSKPCLEDRPKPKPAVRRPQVAQAA